MKIEDIINENEPKKTFINFDFKSNKYLLYTYLFYSFGLFAGAYLYKISNSTVLDSILKINNSSFTSLFFSSLLAYLSLFIICAFLGFCLISKSIINIIPFIIGIYYGSRIGYYFVNFGYKGVVYALIMIVPFVALYLSILSYVIIESIELSNNIILVTKGEGHTKIDMSPYLKKYSIYFIITILITMLSTGLTKLLLSVVTI